jgi:hypothetical protein
MRLKPVFTFLSIMILIQGCKDYPIYGKNTKVRHDISSPSESIEFSSCDIYISAIHTKNFFQCKILDTIPLQIDKDDLVNAIDPGINERKLNNATFTLNSKIFTDTKKIREFFAEQEVLGNRIITILTYRYSFEKIREGGGGIGFAYDTDYIDHFTDKSVYVAVYQNSKLVFLDNAYKLGRQRVKYNQEFKHEFSYDELDSLFSLALANFRT